MKSTNFTIKPKKKCWRRKKKSRVAIKSSFSDLAIPFANIVNGATHKSSTTASACLWRSVRRRRRTKKLLTLRSQSRWHSISCLSPSLRKIGAPTRIGTSSCTDTYQWKLRSTTKTQVKTRAYTPSCCLPWCMTYLPESRQRWAPWTRSQTTLN